jgi:hypothetical protein
MNSENPLATGNRDESPGPPMASTGERGDGPAAQVACPRCGSVNWAQARYCQQCGYSLLGPAGAKGAPTNQAPGQQPGPGSGRMPGQPGGAWGQTALGGLAGFVLGSLFGGGRGMFGGWDGDEGGDFGGGDFGGGDFGGGSDG